MTIGHLIAIEDGGTDDPSNLAAECAPCNYGDGARRTNSKRVGAKATEWTNPHW